MATFNVEISTKPVSSGEHTGFWQIFIRISQTLNGKQVHQRTGTGIYIDAKDWNKGAKFGKWVKANPAVNRKIENSLLSVKAANGEQVDGPVLFFVFGENLMKDLEARLKIGTWQRNCSVLKHFKAFAGAALQFKHINDILINRYVDHCRKEGNNDGTIMNKFSVLRRVLMSAGHSEKAFLLDKVKFRYKPKKKVALTRDEISVFETFKLSKDYREIADFLLFCIYNWGMRAGDAIKMKFGDFKNGELSYNARKTDHAFTIDMVPKAIDIFKKYSAGKKPTEPLFSFINRKHGATEHDKIRDATSKIDRKLKVICKRLGIDKHITTHCARHTWARTADKASIDRRIIQKALGHTSLGTTETYLESLGFDSVDEANVGLFG